jgi:hypothetical protein
MNHLAVSVPSQVGGFTSFLHTVPVTITYLIALALFLLLAKSERLGGLQFRHVIFGLIYGLLGAVLLPSSVFSSLSHKLTPTSNRVTATGIFFILIIVEFIMIIRDRRKGGGEEI